MPSSLSIKTFYEAAHNETLLGLGPTLGAYAGGLDGSRRSVGLDAAPAVSEHSTPEHG
jgi:hypothetical protein